MSPKISIIGAGNVGFHLSQRLFQRGYTICQIFSREIEKSAYLAKITKSQSINDLSQISLDADIYILAIKDDAIETLLPQISYLNQEKKIIAHTSGTVSSKVFEGFFDNYGVFYPLQSFSIQKQPNFERIPFCIDGNSLEVKQSLQRLAEGISPNVFLIDDEQRAVLHVAAVIVNNFGNYLYRIAQHICIDQKVSFDILKPLIIETVEKIQLHDPKDVQTGPAIRGDWNTINKHLDFLKQYPHYQQIYKILSDGIINN